MFGRGMPMQIWSLFEHVGQDLRYAARLLRLNPGFTLVAVLSLALGIGANAAIFQLIDAVRLRTLPVAHPEQLAIVRIANRRSASGSFNGRYSQLTNAMWEQIRDHQQGFSGIFAWSGEGLNLATGGESRIAQVIYVSGDFFRVLEVPPLLGRMLNVADDQSGCGSPTAILSYSFWQREYGGEASAIGRKLTLEGHPFEIVGVTPADFYGVDVGHTFDVAIPICAEKIVRGEDSRLNVKYDWWLAAMGRLKPGWTLKRASSQLEAISPGIFQETVPTDFLNPEGAKNYLAYKLGAFPAATGFSGLRSDYESPLWLLLAIAGLVLLIACANLANLLLARASAREREIAVRLALGASRGRLIRQLLAESLLLASFGAVLGAGLARVLSQFLVSFIGTAQERMFVDLSPDWRVLGFIALTALMTCVLFGLAPAIRATRTAPYTVLKAASRSATAGREKFGLRRALVVSQVALSFVLLVGALLFVRSLRYLLTLDAGFQQSGIIITNLDFSRLNIAKPARLEYKHQLLERLRAIPGVESAADAYIVPVSGNSWNEEVLGDKSDHDERGESFFNRVSPDYFKTLGTPLLAGREFNEHDTLTSPKVAIVNEAFARKYLGGGNPLGKTIRIETRPGKPVPVYEVVGLVKDTKYNDMRDALAPIVYEPASQEDDPDQFQQTILRSRLPLPALLSAVKATMAQASPDINLEFHVFETQIRESLLRERLMATLSGFFGFLAALLAMIGLYGVISYMVARRTSEIGIRMAMGALPRDVVVMIMREAAILLAIGMGVGAALALAGGKAASSMLYGLKPKDPITFAIALVVLAAVAAAASFLPALRASRLDPMAALRDE